jgi:phosphoglycerol transferase MdoB-like AlkP superfamily enzyme
VFSNQTYSNNLDTYLERQAKGPKGVPPRHIFFIIEESYDSWPLLPKYSSLSLTNRLKDIAQQGLFIKNFLPASDGTMSSLAAIMTGLADAGIFTNYQKSAQYPFPSSLAIIFNTLGYRTRFFYGGYLSWQRVDDFSRAQGFKEIYGAPHIAQWISTNEWGVDDEYLFDFVEKHIPPDIPSFNLILTTAYHPPYSIDVYAKGYPVRTVPEYIKAQWEGTVTLKMLGHLWYADRCLGDFIQKMETTFPDGIFAITGDHYGRKFINSRPDFFERSSVPLVMYGKKVLQGISLPENAAASHIDIGPTLIELVAPKGFVYHALGSDILDPRRQFLGMAS